MDFEKLKNQADSIATIHSLASLSIREGAENPYTVEVIVEFREEQGKRWLNKLHIFVQSFSPENNGAPVYGTEVELYIDKNCEEVEKYIDDNSIDVFSITRKEVELLKVNFEK